MNFMQVFRILIEELEAKDIQDFSFSERLLSEEFESLTKRMQHQKNEKKFSKCSEP